MSTETDRGARWVGEIDQQLETTEYGIVCLTPTNLDSKWLHYEAGALSKTPRSRVCTFLLGLRPAEVEPPLGLFQHTTATSADVRKLVETLNRKSPKPVEAEVLNSVFEALWPTLEAKLTAIMKEAPDPPVNLRDNRELLEEALELLRSLPEQLAATRVPPVKTVIAGPTTHTPRNPDDVVWRSYWVRGGTEVGRRGFLNNLSITGPTLSGHMESPGQDGWERVQILVRASDTSVADEHIFLLASGAGMEVTRMPPSLSVE